MVAAYAKTLKTLFYFSLLCITTALSLFSGCTGGTSSSSTPTTPVEVDGAEASGNFVYPVFVDGKYGFIDFLISMRFSIASFICPSGNCSRAASFSTRTRKSVNPSRNKASSAFSMRSNNYFVTSRPDGMRVARQAYAGLSHVNSPASFERRRI